jgi:hypothetical protein
MEHAPLEEVFIEHLDPRLEAGSQSPVDSTRAVRQENLQASECEF